MSSRLRHSLAVPMERPPRAAPVPVSPCRRRKTNLVSRAADEWWPAAGGRCRLCRSERTRRSPGRLSVSSDDVLDEEPLELSWVSGGPPAARQARGDVCCWRMSAAGVWLWAAGAGKPARCIGRSLSVCPSL